MISLKKAQKITTFVFLGIMLVNMLFGYSYTGLDGIRLFINLFAVHLSVILAYFFAQKNEADGRVPKFKLILVLIMLFIWGVIILAIVFNAKRDLALLEENLIVFPEYAGFLTAGGIVWLFSKQSESSDTQESSD